jgi:ABC-type antimicrobial peptide transport system permease subunit
MGLTAGALMSLNARGLAALTIGFVPEVYIPWWIIWTGSGVVMLIAIAASLWPAWTAARTEPLTLLQSGRAAT